MSRLRDWDAVAVATKSNVSYVREAAPLLFDALAEQGILDAMTAIGLLATVRVESNFRAIEEAHWLGTRARERYFNGTKYGKVDPETGLRYYGRGFIQRTWKTGYAHAGQKLGLDLIHHPELLLVPKNAARDAALFFKEQRVYEACRRQDWREVRRNVNGGQNGWGPFRDCVLALIPLSQQEMPNEDRA